jgi:hypothetical protein
MDLQTLLAIALSAGCGLWALWHFVRPLIHPESPCDDCGGHPAPPPLLQIDPVEAQER